MQPKWQRLYTKDFGFPTIKPENCQDLYVRCCADSTKNPELIYGASCIDVSTFGPGWDFTGDFCVPADIEMCPSHNDYDIVFKLINPEVEPLSSLSHFEHSKHLPIDNLLSNYAVPRLFFGSKSELNPYIRATKRLNEKHFRLVLSGYITYTSDKDERLKQNRNTGEIKVSIFLPRYDYLSEYLKEYF
jgi:hypothetical protein